MYKDWNLVASERLCVNNSIHKPDFVLIQQGSDEYIDDEEANDEEIDNENNDDLVEESDDRDLHGILTFHIESDCWRWHELHAILFCSSCPWLYMHHFFVEGLTFSYKSSKSHRN